MGLSHRCARMRLRIKKRTKLKLANKLAYFPLLRLLLFKFWFRMAFLALVFLMVFLSLFLPKVWRTSPPNFLPVVKVSGLDLVQAWSLQRTARKQMAAGHTQVTHP